MSTGPRTKAEALYIDAMKEVDSLLSRVEKLKKATPVDGKTMMRFIIITASFNVILAGSVAFFTMKYTEDKIYSEAGKIIKEKFFNLSEEDQTRIIKILTTKGSD